MLITVTLDGPLPLSVAFHKEQEFWSREWQPTPVFSPGEFHGQRSLAGCSPWGRTEVDTTEETEHTHTYLCREHSIGDDCGQEWAAQSGFGDEQEASSARAEAG